MEEGYDTDVSMPMRVLIDEWEAHLVTENLARGRGGDQINHYWIIKNMMGTLMEEMISKWNYTRNSVLSSKTKLIELDAQLNRLDTNSTWKCLAIGLCTRGNDEGGIDSVMWGLSMSLDRSSVPAIDTTMNAPFLVSSSIMPLIKKSCQRN